MAVVGAPVPDSCAVTGGVDYGGGVLVAKLPPVTAGVTSDRVYVFGRDGGAGGSYSSDSGVHGDPGGNGINPAILPTRYSGRRWLRGFHNYS